MPITTIFTHIPNPLAGAPSSRCNSTATRNPDIPNEPSPISGHIAAGRDHSSGRRCPNPAQPRQPQPGSNHQKPYPATSGRYPHCLQSSRSSDSLVTSIANLAPHPRAPTRLDPGTSIYQTNPVPFPDTSLPNAARLHPGASGLVFSSPNARHCSIDVRLMSGSI